jgi:SAM-dependent methyltransferase
MQPSDRYDGSFFESQSQTSRRSAERIVPIVTEALRPRSVVDVGCGVGTWLAAFIASGVDDVLGIDGDYVSLAQLQIPAEKFQPLDLRKPLRIERRFDLAMSLEVAEHLPAARSESLIADLVRLAPAVLFSAAIPGQGGNDHINERWQHEWAAMFATHDFRPVDMVRAPVWSDPNVAFWYAQNTLLYVSPEIDLGDDRSLPLQIVHPQQFAERLAYEQLQQRTLGELVAALPLAMRKWVNFYRRSLRQVGRSRSE